MNTKLQLTFRFLFLISCLLPVKSRAQNVNVSGAVSGNGSYATLENAFTAINGGIQTGATILVDITGNTNETSTAILNGNSWTSLSIRPSGGASRSISGNLSTTLINLSGAGNVIIDGLNTGGHSLTIENKSTASASTILFTNDCNNIVIQNCTVLGATTGTSSGTLLFGGAMSVGNNKIRIKNCAIDSSSAGTPVNGIYATKFSTSGKENSTDSIINSSIANFFNASQVSSGIALDSGNTNWTISGCRFFQSVSRSYTTGNTHTAIRIASGDAHTISGNTIGFTNVAGTGIYKMTGTIATRFIGIDLSAGTTTASSVQGNTITAISLNSSSSASTAYGVLCGIRAASGNINIGDITPNIIGGTTGVDLITLFPTTTQGSIVGINVASTGVISIKNNTIGGLTSSSSTAAIAGGVYGIFVSAVSNNITISGNTIGNSTSNNIRGGVLGTTTGSSVVAGIYFSTSPNATTVTNNTIQNLASYGTGTGGYVRGIATYASSGVSSPFTIKGNTISKLACNGTQTGIVSALIPAAGIILSVGANNTITENTIYDVALIGTSTSSTYAAGIAMGNSTTTTISKNKIYNITNAGTSTTLTAPAFATGIVIRSGNSDLYIVNNMISLGTGSSDNTAFIGIMGNHGSTPNPVDYIYHNTVNISGTVTSGAIPSFCFLRGDMTATTRTASVTVKNNIFNNTRSGGTGQHFAIANNFGATASSTGWIGNASNNNVLNANAGTIGYWSGNKTLADWQTASAGDGNSYSGVPVIFVNAVSDLHLNMGILPTAIESNGQTLGTVTTDFDGEARPGPAGSVNGAGFASDIGADEIDGVYKDALPPSIVYTALAATCDTTSRSLSVTISDNDKVPATGIYLPKIYYAKNKGAWVRAEGTLSSGTVSNGTWNFPISTAFLWGGVQPGDTVSYFVVAQDLSGNIGGNPAAGLIATDVNTITSPPTTPNYYYIKSTPAVLTTAPGAVCDSGTVKLGATASAGTLNWYNVSSGGSIQGTGATFNTPLIKISTPFYVDATTNGCTSSRVAVLATVNHSGTADLTKNACDSLVWNGKTYKNSGTYYDTIPTTKGCDSIIKLMLTIHHSSVSSETIIACDDYTWQGTTYTTSGTYLDTIPNKAGCDSLMTLHLTINLSPTHSIAAKACDSLFWRGKKYIASGVYKDSVHNTGGCDSIYILTLTINHTTTSTKTVKACQAYIWNGSTYTKTGIYKDTIPNTSGCDSILILDLTITNVNATVTVNNNVITADSVADSYQWLDCINNYAIIPGETNKSYTAASTGSYAVIEIKNGCIDTSACIPIIVTDIATVTNEQVIFYPNPGKGLYNLTLPEQAEVKIMNLTGDVIFHEKLGKGNHQLNLLKSSNGVYLMHVFNAYQYQVYKLIKQE